MCRMGLSSLASVTSLRIPDTPPFNNPTTSYLMLLHCKMSNCILGAKSDEIVYHTAVFLTFTRIVITSWCFFINCLLIDFTTLCYEGGSHDFLRNNPARLEASQTLTNTMAEAMDLFQIRERFPSIEVL